MKACAESAINRIETTIGELVEIVTQIALESGDSEREGYKLASLTMERILTRDKNRRWQEYTFVV